MTPPLTDQPSRSELVADLYDRHAAGLFAYCADQLGDLGSAADALAAVLSGVPAQRPPRAALYAQARREIQRRDVVYSPPVVDPLIDPATALVERTLRELRPHQREVVLLCEVCGLDHVELARVLEVAPDTAEELAISARHRFKQTLSTALASTGARLSKPVADVYGALHVAPLRDVLGRLPWPAPPHTLHLQFSLPGTARAGSLFLKPLWPSPPTWPLPLDDTDPATSTGIFPTQVSHHEATTAPIPKLRDTGQPFFLAAPIPDPPAPAQRGLFEPLNRAPEVGDVLVAKSPYGEPPRPAQPTRFELPDPQPGPASEPGSLFQPRAAAPEPPVYRLPPLPEEPEPAPPPRQHTPIKVRERHHDWAWELIGFLICVAIAMLVFFTVPTIITP